MEMRFRLGIAALVLVASAYGSAAQVEIDEEFAGPLDKDVWCPCQIDMQDAPLSFPSDPDDPNDRVARIVVDDAALGGNLCRMATECRPPLAAHAATGLGFASPARPSPDQPEELGPTLTDQPRLRFLAAPKSNPYCTPEVVREALAAGEEGECVQRQELRFQNYSHAVGDPRLYSFRFRITGDVADIENSIRWVTAQWKQEPIGPGYEDELARGWSPSPFLAQRFVDGVLYVTVQDELCQCMVASGAFSAGDNPVWADGPARYCKSTMPGEDGRACTASLQVTYGADPLLASPADNWVEMQYLVEASRTRDATIEVYQNGRFIVRVTGRIGYTEGVDAREPSVTKFKIGHYRDYMPYDHAMEIDWLRVERP